MKNNYTLIIIPPENGTTRQIKFNKKSKRFLTAGTLSFIVLIGGLVYTNISQHQFIKKREAVYADLKQIEQNLSAKDLEIAYLNELNKTMLNNFEDIKTVEKKITELLDLPESQLASASSAVSRGAGVRQQSYDSLSSSQNTEFTTQYLTLFQNYYQTAIEHKDKIAHTPTILPVAEGTEIASYFGYRKNPFGGYSKEFHNGVDFAVSYGTEVKATADGKVTFSGWDAVYGRRVTIDHGNGTVTFYGHNSRLLVSVGDEVKKGEVIAYSGNSGRSTGSHLHYGATIDGESVDPLIFTNPTKER